MSDSESKNPVYYSTNTWNLSRSIASAALDYSESIPGPLGDRSGETAAESHKYLTDAYSEHIQSIDTEIWPFESADDLLEMVDKHVGFDADGRPLDDLARAISARIQESPRYEHRSEPDNSDDDDATPEDEESLLDEFDEPVQDIAHGLYRCFISHEGVTYRDLSSQYDQPFPKRSITLMNVANSKGTNEIDRIAHIAEWVDTWFGNDEQVQEVDRFAHEPMGKPVRSD